MGNSITKLIGTNISQYPMNPNLARIVYQKKKNQERIKSEQKQESEQKQKDILQKKYLKYKQKYIMLKNNMLVNKIQE